MNFVMKFFRLLCRYRFYQIFWLLPAPSCLPSTNSSSVSISNRYWFTFNFENAMCWRAWWIKFEAGELLWRNMLETCVIEFIWLNGSLRNSINFAYVNFTSAAVKQSREHFIHNKSNVKELWKSQIPIKVRFEANLKFHFRFHMQCHWTSEIRCRELKLIASAADGRDWLILRNKLTTFA